MKTETKNIIVNELRGSQIGAIVACALGVEQPAPCFTSKAIITSDGFVQANFIDHQGVTRHQAFIGSYADLLENIEDVQLFLHGCVGVDETDLQELLDAVACQWIAIDYRSNRHA